MRNWKLFGIFESPEGNSGEAVDDGSIHIVLVLTLFMVQTQVPDQSEVSIYNDIDQSEVSIYYTIDQSELT